MGILAWIVLGLIAGAIAKALMPGKGSGGHHRHHAHRNRRRVHRRIHRQHHHRLGPQRLLTLEHPARGRRRDAAALGLSPDDTESHRSVAGRSLARSFRGATTRGFRRGSFAVGAAGFAPPPDPRQPPLLLGAHRTAERAPYCGVYSVRPPLDFAKHEGQDRRPRRAAAQPQGLRPRDPSAHLHGRHGALRLRQVVARLRHHLRRGAAPLRGVAVVVCAAVSRAHGEARRRSHRRAVPRRRDRAEEPHQDLALDRRHRDRDLRLPAAASGRASATRSAPSAGASSSPTPCSR